VNDKSNEITTIPKVLESLDIEDSVVSIDAIGTQTEIAGQIREQKGHYPTSTVHLYKNMIINVLKNHQSTTNTSRDSMLPTCYSLNFRVALKKGNS
jgi:predicted transposase YbfD/YdcC